MKIGQINQLQYKVNQNLSEKRNLPAGVMSMPIENSSYASNIKNDNGSYGKAMLGLRSHPSFGIAGLDIAAIILLSLIFGSIVGVNVLDIIRSKYDTTIAMRERELSEANVKKLLKRRLLELQIQ